MPCAVKTPGMTSNMIRATLKRGASGQAFFPKSKKARALVAGLQILVLLCAHLVAVGVTDHGKEKVEASQRAGEGVKEKTGEEPVNEEEDEEGALEGEAST